MTPYERLAQLDKLAEQGYEPNEAELEFAFKSVLSADEKESRMACVLLTGLDRSVLLRVTERLASYPIPTQLFLVPLLAAAEFVEIFSFLFRYLKDITNPELTELTIKALAKTEYFVVPLLFHFLNDPDRVFHDRLLRVIWYMGFRKLQPYLTMFPVLPFEAEFRELFGDDLIESLYT